MKLPGPDHPITITPHQGRVRVRVGGRVSLRALGELGVLLADAQVLPPLLDGIDPLADEALLRLTPGLLAARNLILLCHRKRLRFMG